MKAMKVPAGFSVELVASEPDLINPVAMCFDEKGRIWVTESVEYPKRAAGVGKDKVKVFEIGKDGKAGKPTVFAEGLNIPSGIAVGHGGVWVANSPDILFYKIGKDGKAAGKPEVVVTGFGREDTHELPNSLTWGPDGYLYGWNGVFNRSHVKQGKKEWKFTCAIFRIDPRTREFSLFCEGTSNPWGIAIDGNGSFFASACVIDHLWHLVETGYYHRQGGPYPPFTWKLSSIVKHKHQKAAYCGLVWFDSDAYPREYREKLYMGNIHGGCINSDELTRDGSTYFAKSRPDLLTANDQWFMPVSQKVGPDGCLYVLDWYDRYHCYQDANRDPGGIDRKNGRLYRIRYRQTPRAKEFDLGKESDEKLIERLGSPNVYFREQAQRILTERLVASSRGLFGMLQVVVVDEKASRKQRMHALWALLGAGPLDVRLHGELFDSKDPTFRAWAVRAAGNKGKVDDKVCDKVVSLAKDKSPDVVLQVAIAARKIKGVEPIPVLLEALHNAGDDKVIPAIVWQNLHPLLDDPDAFLKAVNARKQTNNIGQILPRAVERILASKKAHPEALTGLYEMARKSDKDHNAARQVLAALSGRIQTGEIDKEAQAALKKKLWPAVEGELADAKSPVRAEAVVLGVLFGEEKATKLAHDLASGGESDAVRLRALEALATVKDADALSLGEKALDGKGSVAFRTGVLAALGRLEDDKVAAIVLDRYAKFDAALKPPAVEQLTQRPAWAKALMKAIAAKKLSPDVLNATQAARLLAGKDKELTELVTKHWGTVRTERNPEREKVVNEMRAFLSRTRGDPKKGIAQFDKLCGQCHKIHGKGVEVGPDITSNGRQNFELLLSNVFDPSLVIGPGYHAVTVVDDRGKSQTGLLVEDGKERVVLKVQGGQQVAIARSKIDKIEVSKLSMMPEGAEKNYKPQELADLFAFLCLDRPPDDPKARRIPGTPKGLFGEK
jgi:putative membrane-bound dehydrogenase-like protein